MFTVDFKKLKEGSVVYVRTNFGTGPSVKGTVTNKDDDIKNGQPGIDYTDEEGTGWWAYADQIASVYKY